MVNDRNGYKHVNRRLTDEQAEELIRIFVGGEKYSLSALARKYGLYYTTIRQIRNGGSYKWVWHKVWRDLRSKPQPPA
jgi:DNA invertase Pin-like site-specific DNA recombinase